MKSVLISIQPKWCELIASGKKTVEVRKTKPKLETPFKCYIYCTHNNRKNALHVYINSGYGRKNFGVIGNWRSGKNIVDVNSHLPAYRYDAYLAEGKVIGEFVCNYIFPIRVFENGSIQDYMCHRMERSCVPYDDIAEYIGNDRIGYGWEISDFVIYDKPFEVQEQDIKDFSNDVALLKQYIADVVPKSEVERLEVYVDDLNDSKEHLCVMLEEAKVELEAMRTAANSYKMHYNNLARKIFEEIENALSNNFHADCQMGDCIEDYYDDNLRDEIAELKKKYTEEQNK